VTDIVLNLKGIVCRMHSDATEIGSSACRHRARAMITAKDIDLPSGVEILKPRRAHCHAREEDQGSRCT